MKQLFLTSSVHAVAHDIARRVDLSPNNKLVFITTAAEPEDGDLTWQDNDRQSLIDAGFEVTEYTITNKNLEQLKEELKDYKFVYLSGGSTLYLLEQSQKSGFITLIKAYISNGEKIYIGTSAGSIIAGPTVPDYLLEENEVIELENKKGFEFVNFTIMPHWGSKHFEHLYLKGRLEMAYKENQVPLLLLTDKQYIHIQGDKLEIINVS